MPKENWDTIYKTPLNYIGKRNIKGKQLHYYVCRFYMKQHKKLGMISLTFWLRDQVNKRSFFCQSFSIWDFKDMVRFVEKKLKKTIRKQNSRYGIPSGAGERKKLNK